MKIGYARVSSHKQDLKVQIDILKNEGCKVIFSDKYTGKKMNRPEFNDLMDVLKEGDTLVVTKLDRLARNAKEGIEIIENLFERGVRIHVLNVGLLENTVMGRFFLQTMLAVAEMERCLIIERMEEGKEYSKKYNPNYKEGRPKKYNKERLAYAVKLLETNSYTKVEKMTGISKSTLQRAKKEMKNKSN